MPSIQIGRLQVAYQRSGKGPALVLLHGILQDSRAWRPQLADLSDEFTVIAWDAPGAGESSDPPDTFGLAEYADCLSEFVDALDLGQPHVLGLSWGGVLAQEFYRRHPEQVRSLILADTYAGWKGSLGEAAAGERLETCLRQSTMQPSQFVPEWIPGLLTQAAPPKLADEVASMMSEFHPAGFRVMAHAIANADECDLLPQIRVPTLVLWGEADLRSPMSVAEQFRDAIPGARLAMIPGAGHLSNVEQATRFNAEVRDFCRSVP
ncbi:MAG: hypothetical protein A2148_06765 [Chloroflexi bacterium RBG_16_68_14]|nr:MAG: hypothetical protein A2148_06765 [Chloroflexi bacterium RBG_16_68_14]